ncbi:MAG: cupin domain-containing protein [Bacteroidota bacterium]
MFDIEKYISSGIIEEYCLGIVSLTEREEVESLCKRYPEIRAEVEAVNLALEQWAFHYQQAPAPDLKERIFTEIKRQETDGRSDFIIRGNSIIERLKALLPSLDDVQAGELCLLYPPKPFENIYRHEVARETNVLSWVLWVKKLVQPEIHTDLIEKFLVLRGTCQVTLDEKVYSMGVGDFATISTGVHHSIEVTSAEPLMVFFQRIYLSA